MQAIDIAPVTPAGMPMLHRALASLSADLGDRHLADFATLERGCLGAHPSCRAYLAQRGGQALGALLCSPVFSTTRGGGGLYVSDLWVAPDARGQGLGPRLLACAVAAAQLTSGAQFVKLAVYRGNPGARAFYHRLGFDAQDSETSMVLHGAALDRLKGTT